MTSPAWRPGTRAVTSHRRAKRSSRTSAWRCEFRLRSDCGRGPTPVSGESGRRGVDLVRAPQSNFFQLVSDNLERRQNAYVMRSALVLLISASCSLAELDRFYLAADAGPCG